MRFEKNIKQLLAAALTAVMVLGTPVSAAAKAAPDGKTDAEALARSMGLSEEWKDWKAEWKHLKSDWTQISLTPGRDESELNFAWYSRKDAMLTADTAAETAVGENIVDESTEVEIQEEDSQNVGVVSEEDSDPVYGLEEDTVVSEDSEIVAIEENTGAVPAAPKLIISEDRELNNARTYVAEQSDATTDSKTGIEYYSNKVTVDNLKENTTYYYSYQQEDGTYTEPAVYSTKDTDEFSFIYVGDPQIGSSNKVKIEATQKYYNAQSDAVRNDSFNWETTLNTAMARTGEQASFAVSAGDQINTFRNRAPNKDAAISEIEYAGYLSPDILKTLPVATVVGNHDADNANYTYHFNTPNSSELGSNGVAGGDYYFTYGSVLFMMLNAQSPNVEEHKQFIEQTVAANPDCKWRIVTLHQDIYGSSEHSNAPETTNLRYELVPCLELNDVDVVLSGHDHVYSRSHILKGGVKTTKYTHDEFAKQLKKDMDAGKNPSTVTVAPGNIKKNTKNSDERKYLNYLNAVMDKGAVVKSTGESVTNPEGILYMAANSSSGGKYYDLVPRMQTYLASRWQEDAPTYSVIDMTEDTFTINTYRTDTGEQIDNSFTIIKTDPRVQKTNIQKASASSVARQVYTGEAVKPALKVKYQGNTLKSGKDYKVIYYDNINTGTAKAVIVGIGSYTGRKNVSFKIIPQKVVLKSVKSTASKTAKVTYNKARENITGYQIVYSTDSKFKKVKWVRTKKTSGTLKSLVRGKKYYIRVRAYKNISGKNYYGAYSKTLSVKVK